MSANVLAGWRVGLELGPRARVATTDASKKLRLHKSRTSRPGTRLQPFRGIHHPVFVHVSSRTATAVESCPSEVINGCARVRIYYVLFMLLWRRSYWKFIIQLLASRKRFIISAHVSECITSVRNIILLQAGPNVRNGAREIRPITFFRTLSVPSRAQVASYLSIFW